LKEIVYTGALSPPARFLLFSALILTGAKELMEEPT